jgi:hypothetical protein
MEHVEGELEVVMATDSNEYAYIVCGNQYIVKNIRVENALELVRRWNSHEDLLGACKKSLETYGDGMSEREREVFPNCAEEYDLLEAAIAKAERK